LVDIFESRKITASDFSVVSEYCRRYEYRKKELETFKKIRDRMAWALEEKEWELSA
jgi:hypothetical protein